MDHLHIHMLGGFAIEDAQGRRIVVASRKTQALLAYLAYRPDRPQRRDALAALLWGEAGDAHARASLRQGLSSLGRLLGPARRVLRLDGDAVALDAALVEVDVESFEWHLLDGSTAALEAAFDLYHGPLLAGLVVHSAGFDEWLAGERRRLHEDALQGFDRLLVRQADEQRTGAAVGTALRLLAMEPALEEAHRWLIRLYLRQGRRSAALRQYAACAAALRAELGVTPSVETRRLYESLLLDAAAARVAPQDADVSRWISSHTAHPCVGRHAELATLGQWVDRSGSVLALVGEPGAGKSRLAAEFARRASRAGRQVLLGRCRETERSLPLAPWLDALRSAEPQAAPLGEPAREPTADGWLPSWYPLVNGSLAGIDLLGRFELVRQRLQALSRAHPLALVMEDLQWADALSLRLLSFLGVRLGIDRVAIVVTLCEEAVGDRKDLQAALAELSRSGCLTRIDLRRLDRPDSDRMVQALLPSGLAPEVARCAEVVWQTTHGNPLMIAEGTAVWAAAWPAVPSHEAIRRTLLERLPPHWQRLSLD
jgi:DNA-binding SARP family transcriptional activator